MNTTTKAALAAQLEKLNRSYDWTFRELNRASGAHAWDLRRDLHELESEIEAVQAQLDDEGETEEEPTCPSLTTADIDALAARDAERREIDRIEGRILTNRTPAHVNCHD